MVLWANRSEAFIAKKKNTECTKQEPVTREVVDISDDEMQGINLSIPAAIPLNKNKKQKKGPTDVGPVRRSERIAKNLGGFKDAASAAAAGYVPDNNEDTEVKTHDTLASNLAPRFEAAAVEKDAPPPPNLPLETIQAIGVGLCQMPHDAVSKDALNYDNSYDSV